MARILVTGANGFLGRSIVCRLTTDGHDVRAAVRRASINLGVPTFAVGDIGPTTDWRSTLDGCDVVVHLAQIAHAKAPRHSIRRVNVEGAQTLMAQAEEAGVSRFVFMSSVKAVGEVSNEPWTDETSPTPTSDYGLAKRETELALAARPRLRGVSLRPPLVHGPDARANFARLLQAAASGWWLPFDRIDNARSLISQGAVAAAVARVASQVDGPQGEFFIAETPAISTPELIETLRAALGVPRRLTPAPSGLARLRSLAPLFGSLAVDASRFHRSYPGAPFADVHASLTETASAWKVAREGKFR